MKIASWAIGLSTTVIKYRRFLAIFGCWHLIWAQSL